MTDVSMTAALSGRLVGEEAAGDEAVVKGGERAVELAVERGVEQALSSVRERGTLCP
jgi:hypothetical protein